MSVNEFIQLSIDNIFITIFVILITVFIIIRARKTFIIHLAAKKYVKKAKKLRKKKWNGILLVDKIHKKRKKGTNTFNKLKGGGKKRVKKYFIYKLEELPVVTKYSYGKLLKRSSDKLMIFAKNDKKIVKRVRLKKGLGSLIDLVDRYSCLDEMIHYLHNLPEAILDQQDYDIYINKQNISIGYIVK